VAEELPELIAADVRAWQAWLRKHHTQTSGVWLVLAKKGTTTPTVLTYEPALQEALCYGWIDGQAKRRDEATYCQRFTPRRARSPWSQSNVARVAQLRSDGRMQRAGEAEVERAQGDGRWAAAYSGQATTDVPADVAAALAKSPRAQAMFAILTAQNRYSILHRVDAAKRPTTRSARIEQFVAMLARGETVHPQRRTLES
jgi:uncharacterized protein YdeI (YjbR/CyaY-like superfamily)